MTIRRGDDGDDVKAAQIALKSLGLLDRVDGDFGPKTEAAVKKFQKAHSLKVDGIVGPKTWDMLLKCVPAEMPEPEPVPGKFVDGWYTEARKFKIHDGRIGKAIDPKITVVHTTDMAPGTMSGLVKSWTLSAGEPPRRGVGAHFIVGRRPASPADIANEKWPTCGLVQIAPVNRNGNHAGGGGKFVTNTGAVINPNLVAVGIELDCAGRLGRRTVAGTWMYGTKTAIPEEDVYIDERGVGWHKITDYQFEVLDVLLRALDEFQTPLPDGYRVVPNGGYQENGATWGAITGLRIVGHVTLNPNAKTDPGPQVMDWLRRRKP